MTHPPTTTTDPVSELLGRVRAATGPDRELDAMILCVLLAPAGSKVEQSRFNGAWCIYAPASYGADPFRPWESPAPWRLDHMRLTASIDAALALAERLVGDRWFSILLDAMREFGAAGTLGPAHLPRYVIAAILSALIAGATP